MGSLSNMEVEIAEQKHCVFHTPWLLEPAVYALAESLKGSLGFSPVTGQE